MIVIIKSILSELWLLIDGVIALIKYFIKIGIWFIFIILLLVFVSWLLFW